MTARVGAARSPLASFAGLLACPGVRETARRGSRLGIMAFHGGSLERGTAEIAADAAAASGASLYTVEQPDDLRWHLPSHLVDPAASPALAGFLDHVDTVVAVHGYGRDGWWTRLLVGGADRTFATRVGSHLRAQVPGFEVVDDLAEIPRPLRGLHADNPVNRTRAGGVQLELPPRIRGIGPNARPSDRANLVAALASL